MPNKGMQLGAGCRDDITVLHMPALPARVRSLIGAGDSLNAGCIDALLRGLQPEAALAFGVVCTLLHIPCSQQGE